MKFKSDIEVQAGLKDSSGSNGLSGQVLSSNGTTVSWINAGGSFAETVKNQVKASVAINKGQAVYETGADGTNIVVGLASNASEATSSKTLGLLDATVAINGFANVVQIGKLSGLNTSGATAGDPVWLGVNGNLIYGLANKPYAPKHLVFIGVVTRVNANNGEIFVNVQNGFELNEIHDVDLITNVPINGDILGFNGTLWVNKTIAGWLGYAPANDANVVHNTGNETISGVKTFSNNIIGNAFVKAGGTVDQYLKADGSVSTAMNSRVEVNFIATSGQTTFTTPYEVGQVEVYYNGSKLYPNEFTATNGTDVVLAQAATLGAQISIVKFVSSFNTTSIRTESVFTTTGGQTTFSVNYAPGQVDVFYNGSKLSPAEFTATNGTSVVLGFACAAGESIVIDSFVNQVSGANGTANRVSKFTGVASLGDSQIDDNGTNVSIGYDINPDTYKLDVAGTGKFDGALLADSFATLSGTSSQFLKANGSVDSTSYLPRTGGTLTGALNGTRANFTQTSATDTLYGFNGYAGGIGLTGGAQDGTGGYFVNNSATYPVVKLLGISPTLLIEGSNNSGVKFTVSTTGNIYTAGNVLIGTTTDAGFKLDVNGTGRFSGSVTTTNEIFINGSGNTNIFFQQNSTNKWIAGYVPSINAFRFSNGSSDVLTLSNSGNVGISTTTPSYKFDLNSPAGAISFKTYTSTSNFSEHTYSKDAGFFIDSYQSVGGPPYTKTTDLIANADAGADSQLRLFTATTGSNPIERVRITSQGNLQLDSGELNAPKKFKFIGNRNTGGSYGDIEWYNYQWDGLIKSSIGTETSGALSNGALIFRTSDGGVNAVERMRIVGNGSVEIRKGDGNDALKVYGSGASSYLFLKSSSSYATIGAYTSGTGYFPLYIEGSNLLIGTTTDSGQKLQVEGKIKSRQNSTNNSILMKQVTVGANSTTDVFFDVNTELGVPSGGYIMVEISAIGYGNSGSNGMNYMGIVGGYSGHTINPTYHRATTYVNTITNGSVSIYNPYNTIYGITITNNAGSGMIVLLKLNITWS